MTESVSAVALTGARFLPRPVLFRVGRWAVRSYPAMLYVGCVAGVYSGAAFAMVLDLDVETFALSAIALLIPALGGSRLLYVLQHSALYRRDLRRVVRHADGGAALYGGLVASIAVSVPLLRAVDLPFWLFWDAAGVTMLVGDVFTRFGCLLTGCCAGRPTARRVGVNLPDHRGVWKRRVPTQMLEAAWAALTLGVAVLAHQLLEFDGAVIAVVIALYGSGRLALEHSRESAADNRRGSRWNVIVSLLLVVAGIAALVALAVR